MQLVVLEGSRACRQNVQPQMGVGWFTARVRGWELVLLCDAQGVKDVGGAHRRWMIAQNSTRAPQALRAWAPCAATAL